MSARKPFDLGSAYAELSRACSIQAYDKVVNIATKILSKHPTNTGLSSAKLWHSYVQRSMKSVLAQLRNFLT
ncbi:hypothetical protein AHF37_00472 [Paragonimus kellicotti]|nr:hypothetical protein AHF37_00472 [Paragonimus kellicotti]